tara:strand:+ start:115747 stop:116283 length:537 start_codon:yes stop_codon:yes gene_type:complete
MTHCYCGRQQAGVVLLVSLLVLLVMGIIATTVARTNQLQLHMAGNDEARIAAMQRALAAIDGVIARPANFRTDVAAGHQMCTAIAATESCDSHSLTLAQGVLPATGQLEVVVQRLAPEIGRMPVLTEDAANSTVHYRVAKFEVQVVYDGTADGGGRAALAQGVLVRLSQSASAGGGIP